jgi:hypothetical protein
MVPASTLRNITNKPLVRVEYGQWLNVYYVYIESLYNELVNEDYITTSPYHPDHRNKFKGLFQNVTFNQFARFCYISSSKKLIEHY